MRMPEELEAQRLVLRQPRLEDAHAVFEGWAQDREVTHYLTWRPHARIEQTEEFLRRCIAAWESETHFPYMIALREDGAVAGTIDPRLEGSNVGIGYAAARAHWGRGSMPEAARAIIEWAFGQPSIYRVYATTDIENIALQRILQKVGMQCEGILRTCFLHPNRSDIPRDSFLSAIPQ